MALTYLSNVVSGNTIANLGVTTRQSVFVGSNASLVTTDTSLTMYGTGDYQTAMINGAVHGEGSAVYFNGDGSRVNIGEGGSVTSGSQYTSRAAVEMYGETSQIYNSGFISGASGTFSRSYGSELYNYGTIMGATPTEESGFDPFAVAVMTQFDAGDDVVHRIENHGTIISPFTAINAGDQLSDTNTGFGSSQTTVVNSGSITGDILLGAFDDTVVNSGYIDGNVYMGADDDVFHGEEGTVEFGSRIYLGSGDDEMTGGASRERVYDGSGDDKVTLGAGRDYVRVGGGADQFDGGEGKDYISYYDSTNGIRIDLRDNEISGSWGVNDVIMNFESASGSNGGNDRMFGTDGANTFRGNAGNDKMWGRGGNDKLYGGDGQDFFDGGDGTDLLWGADDTDTFHFDRGEGKDVIKDFENNIDRIELDNFGLSKTAAFNKAKQSGDDVIFTFDDDDGILVVENATIGQLQNDLFIV